MRRLIIVGLYTMPIPGDYRQMFEQSPLSYSEQSLTGALRWIEAILLGSVGTSIAALAMAGVGLAMLSGRMSYRGGARAVIGCFILFGASHIASTLTSFSRTKGEAIVVPPVAPAAAPSLPEVQPSAGANPFDPYAGAAVPTR
jgi:type IV secretory pathway VirB2 component (pilin)